MIREFFRGEKLKSKTEKDKNVIIRGGKSYKNTKTRSGGNQTGSENYIM